MGLPGDTVTQDDLQDRLRRDQAAQRSHTTHEEAHALRLGRSLAAPRGKVHAPEPGTWRPVLRLTVPTCLQFLCTGATQSQESQVSPVEARDGPRSCHRFYQGSKKNPLLITRCLLWGASRPPSPASMGTCPQRVPDLAIPRSGQRVQNTPSPLSPEHLRHQHTGHQLTLPPTSLLPPAQGWVASPPS